MNHTGRRAGHPAAHQCRRPQPALLGLGEHINARWGELAGTAERSLVHWLRRLVFRGAWLDQRVKEGELEIVFDQHDLTFHYVQPDRDGEPIELAPEPSWGRVAYQPR